MNSRAARDDESTVAHLMNLMSGTVLTYASVTRGGLLFSRVLQRLAKSS